MVRRHGDDYGTEEAKHVLGDLGPTWKRPRYAISTGPDMAGMRDFLASVEHDDTAKIQFLKQAWHALKDDEPNDTITAFSIARAIGCDDAEREVLVARFSAADRDRDLWPQFADIWLRQIGVLETEDRPGEPKP